MTTVERKYLFLRSIKLLYVEDNNELRKEMTSFFEDLFLVVITASNGAEGLKEYREKKPDIVLTDLKMPIMDGISMAHEIKNIDKYTPVVLNTAFAEIPDLIGAIEAGVDKYIQKPLNKSEVLEALYALSLPLMQKQQIRELREQSSLDNWFFGQSSKMRGIFDKAKNIAWTPFSVILRGETGSGKSYFARAIHDMSKRKSESFVKIDLGTLPENLIESELFGHEKGAFTGAGRRRKGVFESANGGTVFLDELENASPLLQSRLLSVVEDKEVVAVGSNTAIQIDIRIIGACNRNLFDLVRKGLFREDLYYRLVEFEILLPPLRERKEDIPWLAARFMIEAADELKKRIYDITKEAEEYLSKMSWHGNVRELRNFMRRAVLISENRVLTLNDVMRTDTFNYKEEASVNVTDMIPLAENERIYIEKALIVAKGNKTKAANLLGINITTLRRKLKNYS